MKVQDPNQIIISIPQERIANPEEFEASRIDAHRTLQTDPEAGVAKTNELLQATDVEGVALADLIVDGVRALDMTRQVGESHARANKRLALATGRLHYKAFSMSSP